ncbi:MAG: hypothetical protein Q9164_006337 [Protoblastenia rupestris]
MFQHPNGVRGTIDVLMICQKKWDDWYAAAQTLSSVKVKEFPKTKALDDFKRDVPSVLLFHKLSHSKELMKGAPIENTIDPSLKDNQLSQPSDTTTLTILTV